MGKILITGAGGTVGLKLTRHLALQGREVIALDRSEGSIDRLIALKNELRDAECLQIEYGDMLDLPFLEGVMRRSHIDTVVHCAAVKFVSIGFYYPERLAAENVVAFSNLIGLLRNGESGVSRVVLCSSDKAAHPEKTVMGASKRFLETIGENVNMPGVSFVSVRFGNILHSNGSITTVLDRKIHENTPIRLRDRRMTRYLLTGDDAIELIEFGIDKGRHGDICSIEAPSARVSDIIEAHLLKKSARIPVHAGTNDMDESIHEALFNPEELKNVSRYERFLIYNRKQSGNLDMLERDHLSSSGHSPISVEELVGIM